MHNGCTPTDSGDLRGRDNFGQGAYGVSRDGGARVHEGADFVTNPGEPIQSLIDGVVKRVAYPYRDTQELSGLEVVNAASGLSAKIFYVTGSTNVGDVAPNGIGNVAGHAAVGCSSAVAGSGGGCGAGAGALSAAAGSAWTQYGVKMDSFTANLIANSVVGVTASVLGGGKFSNGATTAAYGYLFNFCSHNGCFDRRFDFNDAVDQWRNGNGSTVTDVKASELNLTDATYTKNPNGSYQIHTSLKYDTGAIYGTVTGVLNSDGMMSINPDYCNFDQKNPFRETTATGFGRAIVRDVLTVVGAGVNGFGTPYKIQFIGSIPAPKDLPK